MNRTGRIALSSGLYFGLTFAAGFVFGPIRIYVVEPRVGPLWAVIAEAPLMLVVMTLVARWVIRRGGMVWPLPHRVSIGVLALAMLLFAEGLMDIVTRGHSVREYLAHFVQPPGLVEAGLLVVFAAMPSLVGWVRTAANPAPR